MVRIDSGQEKATRKTRRGGLTAVGGKEASSPTGRQWQILTATKITERGTHENRRKSIGTDHCGTQNRARSGAGHIDPGALPASGPGTTQDRPPTNDFRSQANAKHFTCCHTDGNAGAGGSSRRAAASSQASRRGAPSQAGRLSRYLDAARLSAVSSASSYAQTSQSGDCFSLSKAKLVISTPLRYAFGSGLRLLRMGCGQFWPVFVPVVRAHVDACDLASAEGLDGLAVVSWNGLFFDHPIRDNWLRYTQQTSHGQRPSALFCPFIEFHARIISHGVIRCQ